VPKPRTYYWLSVECFGDGLTSNALNFWCAPEFVVDHSTRVKALFWVERCGAAD